VRGNPYVVPLLPAGQHDLRPRTMSLNGNLITTPFSCSVVVTQGDFTHAELTLLGVISPMR
jgi:hypothetical protein